MMQAQKQTDFESLFFIKFLIEILGRIENLNGTLQKISLHLQKAVDSINTVNEIV